MTAINTQSTQKVCGRKTPFLLILNQGEEIISAVRQAAELAKIDAASISGLGAAQDPVIAYYNLETQEYQPHQFKGIFELISLNGNITKTEDDETIVHIHMTISGPDHKVYGGHFIEGKVGITAEITVIPIEGKLIRKLECSMGLKLIQTE